MPTPIMTVILAMAFNALKGKSVMAESAKTLIPAKTCNAPMGNSARMAIACPFRLVAWIPTLNARMDNALQIQTGIFNAMAWWTVAMVQTKWDAR
jgi:hypothetical protein